MSASFTPLRSPPSRPPPEGRAHTRSAGPASETCEICSPPSRPLPVDGHPEPIDDPGALVVEAWCSPTLVSPAGRPCSVLELAEHQAAAPANIADPYLDDDQWDKEAMVLCTIAGQLEDEQEEAMVLCDPEEEELQRLYVPMVLALPATLSSPRRGEGGHHCGRHLPGAGLSAASGAKILPLHLLARARAVCVVMLHSVGLYVARGCLALTLGAPPLCCLLHTLDIGPRASSGRLFSEPACCCASSRAPRRVGPRYTSRMAFRGRAYLDVRPRHGVQWAPDDNYTHPARPAALRLPAVACTSICVLPCAPRAHRRVEPRRAPRVARHEHARSRLAQLRSGLRVHGDDYDHRARFGCLRLSGAACARPAVPW